MKTLLAVIVVTILAAMSGKAQAIPIAATVTISQPMVIVGYEKVTKRHWTWHGRAKKISFIPIYAAAPVPEPSTWIMLFVGLGLILYRARSKI